MRISEFSIRNPLIVTALTIVVGLFGLTAYFTMGKSVTPNVNFPTVIVVTVDPGADPATIETQVTKPIEDAIATLPNIDTMISTSNEGVSSVTVQFTTAADPQLISVDVERVVSSVRNQLPTTAESPTITRFDTSAFPVITVALSGPQPLDQITAVGKDRVKRAFEGVKGVQSVSVSGGQEREVHVIVDPAKLEAYGLGLNSVQLALQTEQLQVPAGLLSSDGKDINVRLNGQVSQPEQLGQIVLSSSTRGIVRLKDVATIEDDFKDTKIINRVNGVSAVTITATKLADGDTLAVSRGIRQLMVDLEPSLPAGMKMDVVTDAAVYTQKSFDTIQKTLLEAIVLTGLIMLVFLHTWRSTLIVLVSIPTSLLTTFGLMPLFDLNLNLFSMLAVTLSVGILVDDSIVVLENIASHLGRGEPPIVGAINGRNEIGLAALTITMVDVVVYLPIALISGIVGDFLRPFALVIAVATLTSLLVSFTLTPLLASRFLRAMDPATERGPLAAFGRRWDAGFDALGRLYQWQLGVVIRGHILGISARWVVILTGIVAFAGGIALFASGIIGINIFPSGDQSEINITLNMPPSTSLERTDEVVREIERKLKTVPEVRTVYTNTGGQTFGTLGSGDKSQITVLLVPIHDRDRGVAEVADELRVLLDPKIPRTRLDIGLQNAFGFGGFGEQAIQVAVAGPDPDRLDRLVTEVTDAIRGVPGAIDVNNQNERTQTEMVVNVSRDRAADLGVSSQAAAAALRTAVDGSVVAKYERPGQDNIDIRLRTTEAFRASPDNLARLPILSTSGSLVRLGQVGTVTTGAAPTQINHVDRSRSVTVYASASGRAIGSVSQDIKDQLAEIQLPPGYTFTYAGEAEQGAEAFGSIFSALGISIILMYLLMLMLFRSVTLPLAVLMSLPLALVGALGALALTGSEFTLFSLLGIAVLVGLVGKNAILLVDYADARRREGMDRAEALLEAGPHRLRAIVMTTASMFFGLAPVVIGFEEGSELLKAAALVVIGGLLTSTLLTLVFVPAMYTIFDDIEVSVRRLVNVLFKPRALEPEEAAFLRGEVLPKNSVKTPTQTQSAESHS